MPNARIELIDIIRNIKVYEHTCDTIGNFSIAIPYYSKYKLKVIGEDGVENIVSLELSKHRKEHDQHEIVVVKDEFRSN
jgi:predicted transcriptional regulator